MMIKALEKMNPIKRDKLIDSAMKEFGKNGYDKASTNVIVEESGISKGLLFHYFSTKKELFETLSIYTITLMGETIEKGIDWENGDIAQRLEDITIIKLNMFKRYPYMLEFSKTIFSSETLDEIKEKVHQYIPNYYEKVFSYNIDYSIFKDDIDIKKTITLLQYFLDRYSEDILNKYIKKKEELDLEHVNQELKTYLNLYRQGFYKSSQKDTKK